MLDFVFSIAVLIMSVVIHEVSHGFVAEYYGDDTARNAGRLTLNPLKHIDPFGSIILPLLLYIFNTSILFGWAKPVPYDPRNLKNPRIGERLVAAMGPLSNLLVAAVFSTVLLLLPLSAPERIAITGATFVPSMASAALATPLSSFGFFISQVIFINILLGIFNLVPIPPLDGSKVLFSLLPRGADEMRYLLERYGLFLLLLLL